ncbi:MAG TPA: glycosyltransferase, partial [Pyrinomonadaceae bacterium]
RVALFADTFHEVNGAANVLRRLTDFAKTNGYPFLCIRTGKKTRVWEDGNIKILELERSRASISIDSELEYDPLLWRHKSLIKRTLKDFQPGVLHLTGFNDVSQLGFYFAHFHNLSAVASWHTNGHEYASCRLLSRFSWLPDKLQNVWKKAIEKCVLVGSMKMYFLAQVQLAPNEELVSQMRKMTKRPSFLMSRGVDTNLFSPSKRQRTDDVFTIGYVGRLRSEKNVRFLAEIDAALKKTGSTNYRFLIVGDGTEQDWLQRNISQAEFTGVLCGEDLARAYANMDLFAFPSKTDAFGNVVLEAMAAGVPSVVMPEGGPKFLIEHETNGFVARDNQDFCAIINRVVKERESFSEMKASARKTALSHSWEKIFENVFQKYDLATTLNKKVRVGENNLLITAK